MMSHHSTLALKPIENYISWSSESFYPEELIDLRGSLPPYLARTAEVPPGATAEIVQIFTWGAQTRAVCTDQTGRNLSLLVHSPIKFKYLVKKKAMSKPMLLPEILKKVPNLPLVLYPADEDWTNSPQCKSIENIAIKHFIDERFLVCGKLIRGDQGLVRCLFTIPESLRVRLVTAEGLMKNPHYSAIDWEALLAQLMHVGQSLRLNASLLETALIREIPSVGTKPPEGITPMDVLADNDSSDPTPVSALRPSGPLPPPPPPSIPSDPEVPDESFHYYTLNGIVRDALRAALRAAHTEGKFNTAETTTDNSAQKAPTSPQNTTSMAKVNSRIHHQITLPPEVPNMSTHPQWIQKGQDSKRASLSSEGSTQNIITRPETNVNQAQQLHLPKVSQRSRSPFRRGQRSRSPFRNPGQRTPAQQPQNTGRAKQNQGPRSEMDNRSMELGQMSLELGQRSTETSQRSLDSGYRSLESRRSPAPNRTMVPDASRVLRTQAIPRHIYERQFSAPASVPGPVQSLLVQSPQFEATVIHSNTYNGNSYLPQEEIDHYSASIENLSLSDKRGGVTVRVKGDTEDHYHYSDSLPVTDDGYLSPREVRQVLPPVEYRMNQNTQSNSQANAQPNTSHTHNQNVSTTSGKTHRSVSALDQIPADLSQLTIEEVGQVLKLLNLEQHKDKFLQNMIDGAMLMDLAADDLRDLGLSRVECTRLNKFVREGWRPKL